MVKKLVFILFPVLMILSCSDWFITDGPGNGLTDLDGNEYETVIINGIEWMAENLQTTKYNDGTAITLVEDDSDWTERTSPAYCWYDNDVSRKDKSGAIYNWHAVDTGKLAPEGWHVATDAEWRELEDFVELQIEDYNPCRQLKTDSGWPDGYNGTDAYGFSAVPGGARGSSFSDGDSRAVWWSSTMGINHPIAFSIHDTYHTMYRDSHPADVGFSVRCIKDYE